VKVQSAFAPPPKPKPIEPQAAVADSKPHVRTAAEKKRDDQYWAMMKQQQKVELYWERRRLHEAKHFVHDDNGKLIPGETELNDRWFKFGSDGHVSEKVAQAHSAPNLAFPRTQ